MPPDVGARRESNDHFAARRRTFVGRVHADDRFLPFRIVLRERRARRFCRPDPRDFSPDHEICLRLGPFALARAGARTRRPTARRRVTERMKNEGLAELPTAYVEDGALAGGHRLARCELHLHRQSRPQQLRARVVRHLVDANIGRAAGRAEHRASEAEA
jgi:hypothetical protein